MKKCAKVKNPCRICFQPVTAKNGLRCLGACKKWAHFKCLDYTPGKIQDIKAGLIKVNCPCPDCDNEFKEVQTNKPYNCNKEECPANEELICDSDSCPKKLCSDKSTDYVFNCPDDCPEGSGDERKKKNKDSCPPTCLPPKQCPSPSCPPPPCPPLPCPPPACPPPPCNPSPCPSPPSPCPPKQYCEPTPPPCPPKRCSPPRTSSPDQCPPPKCPRPKSPPCPRRKSPSCQPPPCPRPKSPPCSPSPCQPVPCQPSPCPPSKCLVQKVYSGFESPSDISLHMRGSAQSVVSYCQGSPPQIPTKPKRSSSPKGNKKQSCPKPNRPIPCSHACCPSNQCPPKPCPPKTKAPKNPKSCLDELQNECNTKKCKMLDMQMPPRRATRQPSYLTGSRSSCSGLNSEEPSQNRCMSDPSLSADPRKLLLSAMNQMCNTVGEFQIQFRELMGQMMNALDEAS